MARGERKDLGYLGEDFQYKLVHTFMEDKEFFKELNNIIDQNMFTDSTLKMYVGLMKEYYEREEAVPSYTMMGIALNEKAHNPIEQEIYNETLKKIEGTSSEGVEYIRTLAGKFFKQQNIVKTANSILKIAGDGDTSKYEECVELLNQALNQGTKENFGNSVFDDIGETLSDDYRTAIPTGIGKVDEALEGGLGKGELGVIIGSSSFGKTSMTTAMASHAATYKCPQNNFKGYKVLQIVFEDRIKQIQRKHLGRITGIEAKDLSKPGIIEQVREQLEKYEDKDMLMNNLKIVRFPSGELTATHLQRYIKKLINNGFKPDLTIVDYFECLSHLGDGHNSNEYEKEGKTMRKLESMAGELDMALWIPTQGTKDSVNLELVTMDKAGGSFKKIQIAHIVMSIARTMEDIEANRATIALLKNRAGKSGKVFNNVEFNNGTCRISTDHVDEFDNMIDYNKNSQKERDDLAKDLFKQIREKNKK
jgi:replicative DNA helicase